MKKMQQNTLQEQRQSKKFMPLILILASILAIFSMSIIKAEWDASLTDGLIHYYNFEDTVTELIDIANTSGTNGVKINTPSNTTGRIGSGNWMNETDSDLWNFTKAISDGGGDGSLNFWFNITDTAANTYMMGKYQEAGTFWIDVQSGGFRAAINDPTQRDLISNITNMTNSTWHMGTFVWGTEGAQLWQDGILVANQTTTQDLTFLYWSIGGRTQGTSVIDYGTLGYDEIGVWNVRLNQSKIIQLWNGGAGITYSGVVPGEISVSLLSPINNTQSNADSITFTATLTPATYNLTNATLYIWRTNGTLFNYTTNTSISGSSPLNVTFTISNFAIDNYFWNVKGVQGNGNGTNSSFAANNFTFQWIPFENSGESYNGFTYETKNETFRINITTDADVTKMGAFLVYNGSRYAASHSCSAGLCQIYRTIDIPLLDTQSLPSENNTFYWQVTLFGSFGTFTSSTSEHQQNATNIGFTNAALGAKAVTFYTYNETSLDLINTYFNATFRYYLGSGTVAESANFSLSGASSYNFYINHNQTYIVNSTINIVNSTNRNYFLLKEVYTNTTTTQELFIPDNDVTNIIIEVKDQGLVPITGYWVKIFRYYPGLNQYKLVGSQITDDFGQIIGKLIQHDVKYKFEFYDGNKILKKTSSDLAIACRTSICVIPFVIETGNGVFDRFDDIPFFDYDFTFDNVTNIFTFSWDDQTEDSSTMRLEVIRTTLNQTTTVCNSTSTSTVASLTCSVGSTKASYKAQVYRSVNGEETRIDLINVNVGDIFSTFGVEGLFWAFILLFTCIAIGAFNPSVGAILYGAGFIILGVIGIISMPIPVFFANTLLVIIFIWAIKT